MPAKSTLSNSYKNCRNWYRRKDLCYFRNKLPNGCNIANKVEEKWNNYGLFAHNKEIMRPEYKFIMTSIMVGGWSYVVLCWSTVVSYAKISFAMYLSQLYLSVLYESWEIYQWLKHQISLKYFWNLVLLKVLC